MSGASTTASVTTTTMSDLEAAYVAQTKKLAAVTAALGVMGDRTEAELATYARRVMRDRGTLLTQARRVVGEAHPSEVTRGAHYVPSTAVAFLAAVVRDAEAPLP